MGKSTLSLSIAERLDLRVSDEPMTSVCHFFIREDYDQLSNIGNILRACAFQAALKDAKYRDQLVSDLKRASLEGENDSLKVFDRLFVSKYPKDGNRRAIISEQLPMLILSSGPF
jgi:hypothetical protein